ncbi:DNA cytosine methyltransferase [Phaeocystidibacter luteus]|uniref:Cytosine-specific methyltransferase n=1 Tax=Phaeocystidibacter luteus TaxID=911197 RepID=A0A6N6RLZ4_9FLAO|nr:DNA cytosine methyltransferase [Phaeocystidibacter luteus]KAB2814582.1 DNA cytosine methyltransferase [Phaeocystidibacter luteus]
MINPIRFGSACSGIDAASVAWGELGWKAQWFSEIAPFPSAVLNHHYPEVPNLGDLNHIHETETFQQTDIDVLVGGTPCQDFSIAGPRGGLDSENGQLALVFLGISKRKRPRWVVWENVTGVLSENEGRTFATITKEMEKIGYGWAYRVMDAQYFDVAQHRERVFLIGYLGDWRPAAAVLFERESLSRNSKKGKKVFERNSNRAREGVRTYRYLNFKSGIIEDNKCATLRGKIGSCDERNEPAYVVENAHVFKVRSGKVDGGGKGYLGSDELAFTLSTANDQNLYFDSVLRRLTPVECERLQGFPDNYTNITYRNKPAADLPRYHALGNSMAVPVMKWIGERIQLVENIKNQSNEK